MTKPKRKKENANQRYLADKPVDKTVAPAGVSTTTLLKPIVFVSGLLLLSAYTLYQMSKIKADSTTTALSVVDSNAIELVKFARDICGFVMVNMPSLLAFAYYQRQQTTQQLALSMVLLKSTLPAWQPLLVQADINSAANQMKNAFKLDIQQVKKEIKEVEEMLTAQNIQLGKLKQKYEEHIQAAQQSKLPTFRVGGLNSAINTARNCLG